MCSLSAIENPEYGICLNSYNCEVFNKRHTTYKFIKGGCLAKFQYRKYNQNCSVLTLGTNKNEVCVSEFLQYIFIDLKLFKYLNAINDFEERLNFFTNDERREFVLHLEKNSIVSVGFSSGKQTKALFYGVHEKGAKIFVTVELLETTPSEIIKSFKFVSDNYSTKRFIFSLPANLIRKPAFLDIVQKPHVDLSKKNTISQTPVALHENYHKPRNNQTIKCFDKKCSGYHLWKDCDKDEKRPITFTCNKCELENCLKCRTIHVHLTCEQYDKITGEGNSVDKETAEMFLIWIREGIAMPCPKCEALIEKDEGCDWVQCPFCNIEICWATRGPRWGPRGNGDTSGGCGCDFKVKKCVEKCNNCH